MKTKWAIFLGQHSIGSIVLYTGPEPHFLFLLVKQI